ncbi:hypothetical protein GQX73_g5589 [Xylaria multiplex]|uniref:Uncharacterized protein n=1 Tax=Xylaria multiplex TaxID=323545 RepID=A0A7C8J0I4_9PEZI|nr:hypothetical protein GQX73_g5589 [Xylaria multiplex]
MGDNFTAARPPQYNGSNQPSGASLTGSDSNSTVMADEVAVATPLSQLPPNPHPTLRMDLQFYINFNYDGAVQPLTEQAIAAHNHNLASGSGNGNIVEWVNGHSQFLAADSKGLIMSTARHPRTQTATRTGSTVLSSWSVVSLSAPQVSMSAHGDDGVYAIGSQFADVSAPTSPHLDI